MVITRQGAALAAAREKHAIPINSRSNETTSKARPTFGLVQETYQHNLYHLVVQAILWNQTRGKAAIHILRKLLVLYPNPESLSLAKDHDLIALLRPIGLQSIRAKRLIALGQMWVSQPPKASILYKVRYRCKEVSESEWEIAHLPGVGKYAIDSYRIFHRDQLRGFAQSWDDRLVHLSDDFTAFEPEWKRVVPEDKDLRAFLIWAWQEVGYEWNPITGQRRLSLCGI